MSTEDIMWDDLADLNGITVEELKQMVDGKDYVCEVVE